MNAVPKNLNRKIVALCRKHRIREISLFGSRARGDHRPDSDFDFLIEFDSDARISLFDYGRAWVEFEELMGTKIDLVDKRGLKPEIKDRVLSEARLLYEK